MEKMVTWGRIKSLIHLCTSLPGGLRVEDHFRVRHILSTGGSPLTIRVSPLRGLSVLIKGISAAWEVKVLMWMVHTHLANLPWPAGPNLRPLTILPSFYCDFFFMLTLYSLKMVSSYSNVFYENKILPYHHLEDSIFCSF